MISTIINDATIVDGSGSARFSTDIALRGNRIARIGSADGIESINRIEAAGLIAAPGFVDACPCTNDGDPSLPTWNSAVAQGITSAIAFATTEQDVREACEAGAPGVSLDLSRITAARAFAFASDARDAGAPRIAVELRDYGRDVLPALEEAIELAARADVQLHLSHLQTRSGAPAGAMERALERIDVARMRGAAITCDVYPYVAVWIELASLLPPSISKQTLDDERAAAAVALEMEARLGDVWHDIMLAEVPSEERMAWCGMRFDEIGRQMRMRPARALLEFVRRDGERARAFAFLLREDDVATALSARFCAVGTAAPPMSFHIERFGLVHPRAFGTMPRVIGRFVRQRRTLDLEEAIYRMTALPARTFGLDGYGELREGGRADIVLFEERGFVDTATYERPVSPPLGLKHVWVAGHRKGA